MPATFVWTPADASDPLARRYRGWPVRIEHFDMFDMFAVEHRIRLLDNDFQTYHRPSRADKSEGTGNKRRKQKTETKLG